MVKSRYFVASKDSHFSDENRASSSFSPHVSMWIVVRRLKLTPKKKKMLEVLFQSYRLLGESFFEEVWLTAS